MEYKVGDKVKIKSLDWYNQKKDAFGFVFCNHICFDEKMTEFCGKTVTIVAQRDNKYYLIMEDNGLSFWSEDMFECLVERNGKTYPYKIGDRVILKGNNRCATITDLKYNSWGNLSYYIKIDNDKDIEIDYPTELLLPYDNVVEDVDEEPQDKNVESEMVNKEEFISKACSLLYAMLTTQDINDYDYVTAPAYDDVADFVDDFCKSMEE